MRKRLPRGAGGRCFEVCKCLVAYSGSRVLLCSRRSLLGVFDGWQQAKCLQMSGRLTLSKHCSAGQWRSGMVRTDCGGGDGGGQEGVNEEQQQSQPLREGK